MKVLWLLLLTFLLGTICTALPNFETDDRVITGPTGFPETTTKTPLTDDFTTETPEPVTTEDSGAITTEKPTELPEVVTTEGSGEISTDISTEFPGTSEGSELPGTELPLEAEIFVDGEVYISNTITSYGVECADRNSSRCQHFTSSLCRTIQAALSADKTLENLVQSCSVLHDRSGTVLSSLTVSTVLSDGSLFYYSSPAMLKLVRDLLRKSSEFAKEGEAYYGTYILVDADQAPPENTHEIFIDGEVFKDGAVTNDAIECEDRHSARCFLFAGSLCETIKAAIHSHEEFDGMVRECTIHGDRRGMVLSSINIDPELKNGSHLDYQSPATLKLIRDLLFTSSKFAKQYDSYYGRYVTVAPDRAPVEEIQEIFVLGEVYIEEKITNYAIECEERYSSRCMFFTQALCETMMAALYSHKPFRNIVRACGIEGDKSGTVLSSLQINPHLSDGSVLDYQNTAILKQIRDLMFNSRQYTNATWPYYANYVIVSADRAPVEDSNEIFVDGEVYKNDWITNYAIECEDRYSSRCMQFTRTLCLTMKTAVSSHERFKDIVRGCTLYGDRRGTVLSSIHINPHLSDGNILDYRSTENLNLIRDLIFFSSKYAKDNTWSHYGYYVTVSADVPPVEEKHEIYVDGEVYKDGQLTSFSKECEERFSSKCKEFSRTLCITMQAALKVDERFLHLVRGCGLHGDKNGMVLSSLHINPHLRNGSVFDYKDPENLKSIKNLLLNSHSFAKLHYSYYSNEIQVSAAKPQEEHVESEGSGHASALRGTQAAGISYKAGTDMMVVLTCLVVYMIRVFRV